MSKSKTLATWLALAVGSVGAHRLYLHGPRQVLAWTHLPLTLLGLWGLLRVRTYGQDDRLAWCLLPLLGLMLAQGALHAIVYGLMPDETWQRRYDPTHTVQPTRWGPVLGAIAALLLGGAVLTSTIAYTVQRLVEWQLAA